MSQFSDETVDKLIEKTRLFLQGDQLIREIMYEGAWEHVREIRKSGLAFSNATVTTGAGVIAMPLPVTANGMRRAVAAGGVSDRLIARREALVIAMSVYVQDYAKSPKRTP